MHESPKVECALALARQYTEEIMHLEQVARLSAALFDALRPIHALGPHERDLLCCAALLHDIGISVDYSGHHKHSLRLILQSSLPVLTREERETVANIARYHRKAEPKKKHKAFAGLSPQSRDLVCRLAAILRLADGLDRAHENAVTDVEATTNTRELCMIGIYGYGDISYAAWGAERKARLFEDVYGVKLRFEVRGSHAPGSD